VQAVLKWVRQKHHPTHPKPWSWSRRKNWQNKPSTMSSSVRNMWITPNSGRTPQSCVCTNIVKLGFVQKMYVKAQSHIKIFFYLFFILFLNTGHCVPRLPLVFLVLYQQMAPVPNLMTLVCVSLQEPAGDWWCACQRSAGCSGTGGWWHQLPSNKHVFYLNLKLFKLTDISSFFFSMFSSPVFCFVVSSYN